MISRGHSLACAWLLAVAGTTTGARADDDDAIARYRTIWNPFSAGPELLSSADLQPRGQMFVRPYIFSELAYGQYGGSLSVTSAGLDQKLYAIAPQLELSYGILDWLEYEMYVPETSWWQTSGGGQGASDGHGLGDITAFLKWRFHVQQPDEWLPSLTETLFVTLPTSEWAGSLGTPPIPRRLGDIFQYRLAFEQFLDDSKGFGYAVEVVGIHGLPFRLDGKAVDAGRTSFGLVGVQPSIEYDFTDRVVGAAGVLVTAAGYNDVAAVYPNLSFYYYWNPRGKVLAR